MEQDIQTLTLDKKISILSQISNYYAKSGMGYNKQKTRNGKAVKILPTITKEEALIIFNTPSVQNVILNIDNTEILRTIFRKVPPFFQEIMFSHEKTQDLLLAPRQSLNRKELFDNYNRKEISFNEEELRQLENFLHSIKSPKIYEQIIESKYFQRIIALCSYKQLSSSFFKGINEVKLFYNIINDEEIFNTYISRKRNILTIFNNVSEHILLSDDYDKIVDPKEFLMNKRSHSYKKDRVIVDKRTLSLMTTEMIKELLEFKNIDKKFIQDFLEKGIIEFIKSNNFDFNKIFPHLLNRNYIFFSEIDYIYFNVIIDQCKDNEIVKNNFIDFLYSILCNNLELDENEIRLLKEALYNKLKTKSITKEDFGKLFHSPDTLKTAFYLKFGKTSNRMDYLNGISFKQIEYINVKHINKIVKELQEKTYFAYEDELSNTYSCAIKLYLVFGLERVLTFFSKEFPDVGAMFLERAGSLNVKNVEFKNEGNKYLPILSNDFLNFMFSSQNNNHFIEMLKHRSDKSYTGLYSYWPLLYNNFDELKEKCHGKITLKKLNILFKQLSPSRDINDVSPDNYKLTENDILNDICLGNKTKKPNEEIYKSVLDVYEQMKRRTESSIPYVKGSCSNGYSYEMMKLNDPIAFTLGYKGNCCIRIHDIAHNHLLHATLCRNGRILIIYDQNNEIAGFAPLKRNGEVLIANSIECTHKLINEKAIEAFKEAIKDIVNVSQNNKNGDNPINLVCIGTDAYARPEGEPFPDDIQTPTIFEKDDLTYRRTDVYHKNLTIIYKNPKLDLNNIKYGNPKCSYQDPRPLICCCDFFRSPRNEQEKALKIINAVRYVNCDLEEAEDFKLCDKYGFTYCMYNEDWYIIKTYDGNIYGDYLKYDERALTEYNNALNEFRINSYKGNQLQEPQLIKKLK